VILLDTWAWIEYFSEDRKSEKVKEIVENEECYTCAISIAEIAKWCVQNGKQSDEHINMIKKDSTIIQVDEKLLQIAGSNYPEIRKLSKDIGMIDVIIFTSAAMHGLELVTGDPDFKDLPNVTLI